MRLLSCFLIIPSPVNIGLASVCKLVIFARSANVAEGVALEGVRLLGARQTIEPYQGFFHPSKIRISIYLTAVGIILPGIKQPLRAR